MASHKDKSIKTAAEFAAARAQISEINDELVICMPLKFHSIWIWLTFSSGTTENLTKTEISSCFSPLSLFRRIAPCGTATSWKHDWRALPAMCSHCWGHQKPCESPFPWLCLPIHKGRETPDVNGKKGIQNEVSKATKKVGGVQEKNKQFQYAEKALNRTGTQLSAAEKKFKISKRHWF